MKYQFLSKLAIVMSLAALLALYLFVVGSVLVIGEDGFPLGILKGWGDIALHLGIINVMSETTPFWAEHPAAAGIPLTYPFAINFFSAMLQRVGVSDFVAFQIPMFLFAGLLFFSFWLLGKHFLKRDALAVAFVAIVLFGGGLGFFQFFLDLAAGAPFSHEYTHLDDRTGGKPGYMYAPHNIVWIVPVISFFSHQRAFILGAALGALILWGILRKRWEWLILAGFLPLVHTHTFLAFAMILPVFMIVELLNVRSGCILRPATRRPSEAAHSALGSLVPPSAAHPARSPAHARPEHAPAPFFGLRSFFKELAQRFPWLIWGIAAVLIALPQVIFLMSGKTDGGFFEWWPGWMAKGYENVIWFWTKNFGVVFWGWVIVIGLALWNVGRGRMLWPATRQGDSGKPRALLGLLLRPDKFSRKSHGTLRESASLVPAFSCDFLRNLYAGLRNGLRERATRRYNFRGSEHSSRGAAAIGRAESGKGLEITPVIQPPSSKFQAPSSFLRSEIRNSLMIASIVLFAVSHLVKFQPWEFDNGKVLLWWWVLAVMIILSAIGDLIAARRKLGILLLASFLFFGTFAGFLDVVGRMVHLPDRLHGYYDKDEVLAAEWIRANTAPREAFLTAGDPTDFVPILAGRPLYLGFTGWLWSHGRGALVEERQAVIAEFLMTGDSRVLCESGVRYLIWDFQFDSAHPMANRTALAQVLEPVFAQEERTIYQLRCE